MNTIVLLVQCVADTHLVYTEDSPTAKHIWSRLCDTFECKEISNQLYLLKKMLIMKSRLKIKMNL